MYLCVLVLVCDLESAELNVHPYVSRGFVVSVYVLVPMSVCNIDDTVLDDNLWEHVHH